METPTYTPGVCNIGRAEVKIRRAMGIGALVVTVLAAVLLFWLRAAPAWRLLLFFPAMFSASGFQQAREKFCVGFGFMSVYNFDAVGAKTPVTEDEFIKKDRKKARGIAVISVLIGAAVALGAYFIG